MILQIISLYPTLLSKAYVLIRSLILPISQIESVVPKQGRILDVGCGIGLISIYLGIKSTKRQIIGSDINFQRIKIASRAGQKLSNVKFITANLISSHEKLDCILAVDLFHHLNSNQKKVFAAQSYSALLTNGQLIIKEIGTANRFKFFINYIHDQITTKFENLDYWPSKKMITFLSNNGFNLISQKEINHPLYPHNIYVFKKT